MDIDVIMTRQPVIPVLVIEDLSHALPLAQALVAGGLPVIEVTLRTPCALAAITAMCNVPGAIVGAGTVCNPGQLDAALAAGAEFVVAPGLTDRLGAAAIAAGVPFLPGIATAGDIMRGLDLGLSRFKFFPAEAAGGAAALKALTGPFGNIRVCPTGGITPANAAAYLAIPQVACVGGSWLARPGETDWAAITGRARAAAALRR